MSKIVFLLSKLHIASKLPINRYIQLVSVHGRRSLRSTSNKTLAVSRRRSSFGDISFAAAGLRQKYIPTWPAVDSLSDIWNRIYLEFLENHSALCIWFHALQKYTYLLTTNCRKRYDSIFLTTHAVFY